MGQCLSAAPPAAVRSPLADLTGEKQTSAAAPAGVGGGSGETGKKRMMMSSTFSAVDNSGADPATATKTSATSTGGTALGSSSSMSLAFLQHHNGGGSKRMKLAEGGTQQETTSTLQQPVIGQFLDEEGADDDDGSNTPSSIAAAAGASTTEMPAPSSVKKLQGWLSDFERKQREHSGRIPYHHHHGSTNAKPNVAAANATPSRRAPTPAPTPAQQPVVTAANAPHTAPRMLFGGNSSSAATTNTRTCSSATKPKPRPSSSVEATNDGYAAVSQLSAWLEDDPTASSKKNKMGLAHRRGRNVSSKSRKFEPLPQNEATRTVVEFRKNGVSERKQWLESAFAKEEETKATNKDGLSVADRAKWLQGAFAKKQQEEAQGHRRGATRDNDDGHVTYAEVGPEEELVSSGRCAGGVLADTEKRDGTNQMTAADGGDSVVSSTCSSFRIGKQILESRTEKNGARGVGQQQEEEKEEEDLTASVQRRRAAFEARAQSENGRRPVGAVRAHWEMGGSSGPSSTQSYTKTYVPEDDRRCTPAKKLSDLP